VDAVKLVLALAALSACTVTTIDRPALPTTAGVASSAITVTVSFTRSNGEVAQAQVQLFANGARAVLGPGDALVLRDGTGAERAFEEDLLETGGEYEAELATSDTALEIDLMRNGVLDRAIPAPLPPAFTLVAPATASRSAPITITWDAASTFPMELVATGAPCLPPEGFTAHFEPDTGSALIQPADLFSVPGTCDVTVVATRGNEDATQVRTILLETTP
jgi:hypothetical protein